MSRRPTATAEPEPTARIRGPRVPGRARVADVLHDLAYASPETDGVSLVEAWAARLGVSDETIYHWCDRTRIAGSVTAGDVDAMLDDDEFERFVARWRERRAAARARAGAEPATNPEHEVATLMVEIGRAARTASESVCARSAGGQAVTPDEWETLEADFARMEDQARAAKLRARAARARAQGGGGAP